MQLPNNTAAIRSAKTSYVEIIFKGNLAQFTYEQQLAAIGALAGILNIPRDQIEILSARDGSVILHVAMPAEAIERLIALYEAQDPALEDLGIQAVKVLPHSESTLTALEQQCLDAVNALLGRYQWDLLPRDELARRAAEHLRAGAGTGPHRAVIYAYSHALYAACSGAEGLQRQNQGYHELFRYLHDIARWRYPDVHDDAAQQAIETTFKTFERCREPGTFLAFAIQRLMEAARMLRRQERHLHHFAPVTPTSQDLLLAGEQHPDLSTDVVAGELRARFEQLAAEFLRKHPRASMQFAALQLKYLEGLDEKAISERLKTPIQGVYVLRARAIKKLRADPGWRSLAVEFGILPDESDTTG
jgi:RNA polymerase sigma factor (sigma-70 family)